MNRFRKILALISACALLLPTTVHADLQRGDTGDEVVWLQQLLIGTGWLFEEADGIFGGNTETAVRNYQGYKGWEANGIVDSEMLAQLSADMTILDMDIAIMNGWEEGENMESENPEDYAPGGIYYQGDDGEYEYEEGENMESENPEDYAPGGIYYQGDDDDESDDASDAETHCHVVNLTDDTTRYVYCERHADLIARAEEMLDSDNPASAADTLEQEVISQFNVWLQTFSDEGDDTGKSHVMSAVGAVTHAAAMQTELLGYWYGSASEAPARMEMMKREMVFLCEYLNIEGQGGEG